MARMYICPKCGGKYSEKREGFHCIYCYTWYKTMDGWKSETIFEPIER